MARIAPEVLKRAKQLRKQIGQANYAYYALDAPQISDAEYDRLFHELQRLESDYPALVTHDSPTQRVGVAPLPGFETVQHVTPMLSLNNAFAEDEIEALWKVCFKSKFPGYAPVSAANSLPTRASFR